MKYGIYYAFWEKEWGGNFTPYVKKVKDLGFDILEVACHSFSREDDQFFKELRQVAEDNGIILTGGYGSEVYHNLSSADESIVNASISNYKDMFRKMDIANIRVLGGGLYSYWPVDYSLPFDKNSDRERSIRNMRKVADIAAEYGITLGMEVLNRFEGYMLNTCKEALHYVEEVDRPNVKIMLDTFHMNIEEDSFAEAIRLAGSRLGHFHVGEANRRPPFEGGRIPWEEIGCALREIGYDGAVVMEPFVRMDGQVGKDIRLWRDISMGSDDSKLDEDARQSVAFLRRVFEP